MYMYNIGTSGLSLGGPRHLPRGLTYSRSTAPAAVMSIYIYIYNIYIYTHIYIYIYIYRRFRGSEYALVAAPQTGKSISISFRVRVVRASERARRSCVGA